MDDIQFFFPSIKKTITMIIIIILPITCLLFKIVEITLCPRYTDKGKRCAKLHFAPDRPSTIFLLLTKKIY